MSTSFQSSRPVVVDSELPAQTAATNGKALISNGMTASWNTILGMIGTNPGQVPPHQLANEILPAQSGNAGKFLTSDGSNVSWADVSGGSGVTIPDQTGQDGKVLATIEGGLTWVAGVPNASTGTTYDFLHIDGVGQITWTNKFTTNSPSMHTGIVGGNAETYDLTASVYPSGSCITSESDTPVTITIAQAGSDTYDVGAVLDIIQVGAGQITVAPSGILVGAAAGLKTRTQYSGITLIKVDATTWVLVGDATA